MDFDLLSILLNFISPLAVAAIGHMVNKQLKEAEKVKALNEQIAARKEEDQKKELELLHKKITTSLQLTEWLLQYCEVIESSLSTMCETMEELNLTEHKKVALTQAIHELRQHGNEVKRLILHFVE